MKLTPKLYYLGSKEEFVVLKITDGLSGSTYHVPRNEVVLFFEETPFELPRKPLEVWLSFTSQKFYLDRIDHNPRALFPLPGEGPLHKRPSYLVKDLSGLVMFEVETEKRAEEIVGSRVFIGRNGVEIGKGAAIHSRGTKVFIQAIDMVVGQHMRIGDEVYIDEDSEKSAE